MMRAIVSVATGSYIRGLDRLTEWCAANSEDYLTFRGKLPEGSPSHEDVPYAFKAYALNAASTAASTLLWADASILPIRPLDPLWERIERDGYWIGNNGYTNYEWTADASYPYLFPNVIDRIEDPPALRQAIREQNRQIHHVVATTFGVSLAHPTGRTIMDEYYRLAKTKAFCGPWINTAWKNPKTGMVSFPMGPTCGICGPADVRGHRHDQTALSVIAWRMGCKLTNSPDIFAYAGGETEQTLLVARGI